MISSATPRRSCWLVLGLVVAIGAGASGAGSESASDEGAPDRDVGALVSTAPEGLAFYQPPSPMPGDPGELIWADEWGPVEGGTGWTVLYRSTSLLGEPIAVSGFVAVPDTPAPEGGRPVMAWANGTRGVADECANSRAEDPTQAIPILSGLMERGVVVVATDYEGLGTPGLHPYTVGESEGRSVLDAARAVQDFVPAEAGERVLFGGRSQGGHAMSFANEMANEYAPDLEVLGAVGTSAGAVSVDDGIVEFLMDSDQYRGILLMTLAGQIEAYGSEVAPPDRMLTDLGVEELDNVEEGCIAEVGRYFSRFSRADLFRSDWTTTLSDGRDASKLSEPGNRPNAAPVLLLHARDDALVPAAFVTSYLKAACAHGTPIEIEWWDGGHGFAYDDTDAQRRVNDWVDDRLAGHEPVDSCDDPPAP